MKMMYLLTKYFNLKKSRWKVETMLDPNPDSQASIFPYYSLGDFTRGLRSPLLTQVYLPTGLWASPEQALCLSTTTMGSGKSGSYS